MVKSNQINFGDKINSDDKETIIKLRGEIKPAITNKDINKVTELKKTLEDIWNPIMETIYKEHENPESATAKFEQIFGNPLNEFKTGALIFISIAIIMCAFFATNISWLNLWR